MTGNSKAWLGGFGEIGKPYTHPSTKQCSYEVDTSSFATTIQFNELKTSVSEGKALVAAAVTDKGVTTAADATFSDIALNIQSIQVGPNYTITRLDARTFNTSHAVDGNNCWNSGLILDIGISAKSNCIMYGGWWGGTTTYAAVVYGTTIQQLMRKDSSIIATDIGSITRTGTKITIPKYFISSKNSSGSTSSTMYLVVIDYD